MTYQRHDDPNPFDFSTCTPRTLKRRVGSIMRSTLCSAFELQNAIADVRFGGRNDWDYLEICRILRALRNDERTLEQFLDDHQKEKAND